MRNMAYPLARLRPRFDTNVERNKVASHGREDTRLFSLDPNGKAALISDDVPEPTSYSGRERSEQLT